MSAILLVLLVIIDVALLAVVFFLGRQRVNPVEWLKELTEERRLLGELRRSIQEEMGFHEAKSKQNLDKILKIATDIEWELKSSGQTLGEEAERILGEITVKIEKPMQQLSKRQAGLEQLLKRVDTEKQMLTKALARGEAITQFFNTSLPYHKVLEDIEDKKYLDARHLLAQGMRPQQVAQELGLAESQVKILLGLGR